MKLYGKSFGEIFAVLPLTQKIVVIVGAVFSIYALLYIPYSLLTVQIIPKAKPGPLTVSKDKNLTGFFDPSIVSFPQGKKKNNIMAFTVARQIEGDKPQAIEVRLATSNEACENWTKHPGGLVAREEEILGPDGSTPVAKGIWRVETPSIVYDPNDKGREWKLYAYRYFWAGSVPLARLYSMIVYAYAPADTMRWSTEEWLFSATPDAPPPPYGQIIQQRLNALSPGLADVYFYSRPSVTVYNNDLLMTLSAFVEGKETPDRVIMLGSADHGKTWKYLGTPLRDTDAAKMGKYTRLSGATLLQDQGRVYLAAVLGDNKVGSKGTLIIPFDDLSKGLLKRDKNDAPDVKTSIPQQSVAPTATGGGFAAYSEACDVGIITAEWSGLRKDFTLFKTLKKLDGSDID